MKAGAVRAARKYTTSGLPLAAPSAEAAGTLPVRARPLALQRPLARAC